MSSAAAGGQSGVTPHIARRTYRPTPYPIVRIHLLGPMRATSYLGDDVLPHAKKARAALGYLCLTFGAAVPRTRLASMLWDRADAAQARSSFRQVVKELTALMGPLAGELISIGRATVRLNTDLCWIDALALLESSSPDLTRSDLAVLCAGELLEGLENVSAPFGQWLSRERGRLKEQLWGPLDSVLRQIDRPDFDGKQIVAVSRRLISLEPTHEGASRALMRALARMGQREEALLEYERCREALMNTLRVEPSAELKRVYETIRARSHRRAGMARSAASTHVQSIEALIHKPLPGRNRLRVGVLSFDANGAESERNLAFSLSHQVATALARFRWFDVITPVSMMQRPLATLLSKDIFQRHQLDYAVDGVVMKIGNCYHISVRLLDLTRRTYPVWSDRFKLAMGELHRLNELVIARIVGGIDPVILFIEGQPKRKERYGATGLLLLAIPLIYSMERRKYHQAGQFIERALAIEPDNAMVLTWSAYWHLWNAGQCWTSDLPGALLKAEDLCVRAMKLDPDNSEALGIYAYTRAWKKEFDAAVEYFNRSLRLNPNVAYIWALSAAVWCYLGEPKNALRRLSRYRDLAPFDPYFGFFENAYTVAYLFNRDYERAVVVGRRVVKTNPEFINGYKPLIASLGHLRRRDEAKPYIAKLLSMEPDFSIAKFRQAYPFKVAQDRDNYCKGPAACRHPGALNAKANAKTARDDDAHLIAERLIEIFIAAHGRPPAGSGLVRRAAPGSEAPQHPHDGDLAGRGRHGAAEQRNRPGRRRANPQVLCGGRDSRRTRALQLTQRQVA